MHITEWEFHQGSWDPFSRDLHGKCICVGMSGRYLQKPGDLQFLRQLFELLMYEGMDIWPEAKPDTFAHWKRLPAICTGSFGEGTIHSNGDLRAQFKRRAMRAQVGYFLLNRCDSPYIPYMSLILQFFQTNRQGRDGGAVIQ